MAIQEIKKTINRQETAAAGYLFSQLKKHDNGQLARNAAHIIFYAFENQNRTWQLWFGEGTNRITVNFLYYQSRSAQEHIRLPEYDIDFDETTVFDDEFIRQIQTKLDAFRKDHADWQRDDLDFFKELKEKRTSNRG